ncbi:MAG: PaaI family thioesterase [Egibacteraceae bacterium]
MQSQVVRERLEAALAEHRPEFERFFLARFLDLGISYERDSEGCESCTVVLPGGDYLVNPQGSLHGGIIALVMDVSMGHLCHHFLSTAVTLEMKTSFLAPVRGGCRARAQFVRKGRSLVYLESRLLDDAQRLAAVATATWHRLSRPATQAVDDDVTRLRGGRRRP